MASHREECLKKWNDLYSRFYHEPDARFTCFYCGEPANTFDHQPPITRVPDFRSSSLDRERYVKVPACRQCNALASDELTESLWDRFDLVKSRLEKKYKKLLRCEGWTNAELQMLGPNLKGMVSSGSALASEIRRRLDYHKGIQTYIDNVEID